MVADPRPIDPEELLEHTRWMRALARGLVRDDATAEDLVQQAYTAALEHPPRDRVALGAWLGRVVRNLAARVHRDAARRERRERQVARPEQEVPEIDEVLARAELQRRVMDAVLDLDEPFRTTVLLRYHEQLSPADVARRLGVPLSTVGTRLHRALGQLRERLDRESGGRAAWVALLAPWVGLAAAGTAATASALAGGGSGSSAGTGVGVATGTSLAATGSQALSGGTLLGGIFVMQKAIITGVVVCAVSLAAGYGIGRESASDEAPAEGERIVASAEYDALVDREQSASEEAATLRSKRDEWSDERKSLVARAEKAEMALAAEQADVAPAIADEGSSTLVVAFGEWGDLPELHDADWTDLAAAVTAINDLVLPLVEDIAAGNPVSTATQMQIQEHNQKLVRHGVSIMEKVPSNAPMAVNGEFTHPVNLINLIAGMLENAGVPLAESQRREISAIGVAYDSDWRAINGRYDESTWQLTKIVDELELKRNTMLEVEQKLTPAQLAVVAIPRIQNRIRLDTVSPVNMVIMNIEVMGVDDPSEIRAEFQEGISGNLGIAMEDITANEDLFAQYESEVEMILDPVQRELLPFVHLDDIVIAGRAQERLLIGLASRIQPSEELLMSLSSLQAWAVPQVRAAATP